METTQNSKSQGPATPTTQEIEIRCELSDVRIESRSDDPATGRTISGYAAKFDKWSSPIRGWFIEMIAAGAFDDCDMTDVIMCFNHNENSILARTVSKTLILEVDAIGLRFSFDAPNTACGNDMVELVGRGDVRQCSFRFVVSKDEWTYADEENGLEYDQRKILAFARLFDVSLVVYPAYNDTEASVRHLEERKAEHMRSKDLSPGEPDPDRCLTASRSRERLCEVMRRAVN